MTDETEVNITQPEGAPVPESVTEANAPEGQARANSFIINHINTESVHFATRVSAGSKSEAEATLLAAHAGNRVMATYPDYGQTEQDDLPVVDLANEP